MSVVTQQNSIAAVRRHVEEGRLVDAIRILDGLLKANPQHPEALLWAGISHFKGGSFDRARRALAALLMIRSDHLALYYLGLIAEKQGRADEALALFGRALEVAPSFREARAKVSQYASAATAPKQMRGMEQIGGPAPQALRPPPEMKQRGRARIRGTAKNVRASDSVTGRDFTSVVLSFRLVTAVPGARPIDVRGRGSKLLGTLDDGDEVEVSGKFRHGVLWTRRIQNLTTGMSVKVRVMSGLAWTMFLMLSLIVVPLLFGALAAL